MVIEFPGRYSWRSPDSTDSQRTPQRREWSRCLQILLELGAPYQQSCFARGCTERTLANVGLWNSILSARSGDYCRIHARFILIAFFSDILKLGEMYPYDPYRDYIGQLQVSPESCATVHDHRCRTVHTVRFLYGAKLRDPCASASCARPALAEASLSHLYDEQLYCAVHLAQAVKAAQNAIARSFHRTETADFLS